MAAQLSSPLISTRPKGLAPQSPSLHDLVALDKKRGRLQWYASHIKALSVDSSSLHGQEYNEHRHLPQLLDVAFPRLTNLGVYGLGGDAAETPASELLQFFQPALRSCVLPGVELSSELFFTLQV